MTTRHGHRHAAAAAPDDAPPLRLVADDASAGQRLDVYLSKAIDDTSRSHVQKLIRDGRVTLNGSGAKTGAALSVGDLIVVTLPRKASGLVPEDLAVPILFEDRDLVVVNKPAGMVVHPSMGHGAGTLVHGLLHLVPGLLDAAGSDRPGIVHRLDRGTSGVLVVAKTERALRELARQFHDREVDKDYVALVWGTVERGETYSQPIGRDPRNRLRMSSRSRRARTATTTVRDVEPLKGVSFVRLSIATGRTHQIRVHLSEAGHPVVGDAVYHGVRKHLPPSLASLGKLERPFLHAARLEFTHPATGLRVAFSAPLPQDLEQLLDTLRRMAGTTPADSADVEGVELDG